VNWRCRWLRWHRLSLVVHVSAVADHLRCSCGREYGINHDVRAVLPWAEVRSFYETRGPR
jgi:hypothetical protein